MIQDVEHVLQGLLCREDVAQNTIARQRRSLQIRVDDRRAARSERRRVAEFEGVGVHAAVSYGNGVGHRRLHRYAPLLMLPLAALLQSQLLRRDASCAFASVCYR